MTKINLCDEYVGGSSESHIYQISHVLNLRPSDFIIQPVPSLLFETSFLTWNFVSRSKIKLMVVLYCFARLNKHPFRISKYQIKRKHVCTKTLLEVFKTGILYLRCTDLCVCLSRSAASNWLLGTSSDGNVLLLALWS